MIDETAVVAKALRGELSPRELAMIGLAEDTRKAINATIALDPALEESILNIADLCYRDGADSLVSRDSVVERISAICDARELARETARCERCGNFHDHRNTVRVLDGFDMYAGHEYEITTQTRQQRYARLWRMGFMGPAMGDSELEFSARGPDRTHHGQYGGTVRLRKADVIAVREVERSDALRHVGRQVR